MGIDPSAVARGVGVTTNFKDLSGGAVRFLPQRIALIAPGEDGVTYSTDKYTIDGGAQQVGATNGYSSPLYQMARELFPVFGDGIGTVVVDVIPLENPSGGAAAVGALIVTPGTATETASYVPVIGGVRGQPVLIAKGVIDISKVLSDVNDSISNTLGMPAKSENVYGTVSESSSANIALANASATGKPKGGVYKIVCSDATNQLFNVLDPNGQLRAKDLAVGTGLVVDGLTFDLTATVAILGEEATITVQVTGVSLTAGFKGSASNDIQFEIDGPTSFGVTWGISNFTGGAGETDVTDALAKIGQVWNTMVLTTEKTETQLNRFQQWGEGRWGALVYKPAVVFYGDNQKTVGEATFITQGRGSDRVTCQLVDPGSNNVPWVIAAAQVNRIVSVAQNNPPTDYGSQPCFTLNTGKDEEQWDYNLRNLAIEQGSSTIEVKDGVVNVSDVVTPWSPTGEVPPAYRYVVDIIRLQNIIYNLDLLFNNADWDGAPLIPEGPTTNPRAKTPAMAIAAVAGLIDNLALGAIISDPDRAKESITANINPSNPKRLDIQVTVQLSGNANIRDVTLNWGFFFGSAPVVG